LRREGLVILGAGNHQHCGLWIPRGDLSRSGDKIEPAAAAREASLHG
jgi:hypothetical protein